MNEIVRKQILAIRISGTTNMFDAKRVQYEADRRGFYELVIFLTEHPSEYSRFILAGEA